MAFKINPLFKDTNFNLGDVYATAYRTKYDVEKPDADKWKEYNKTFDALAKAILQDENWSWYGNDDGESKPAVDVKSVELDPNIDTGRIAAEKVEFGNMDPRLTYLAEQFEIDPKSIWENMPSTEQAKYEYSYEKFLDEYKA